MNVLLWVILGAIAGWLASVMMKSSAQNNVFVSMIIGIIGASIGGWVMNTLGGAGVTGINLYSLLVAVLGSVILIAVARAISH